MLLRIFKSNTINLMTSPHPTTQKRALARLREFFADEPHAWVIHYSCESFYERTDGRSPRITSIAVRAVETGQTVSFSIHQQAERASVRLDRVVGRYDQLERQMLTEFFEFLRQRHGAKFAHWNMRDINYGFAALEHRFRVLGGDPFVVPDHAKFDIARMLVDIYGPDYADNPRLESTVALNGIKPLQFMTGGEEAKAFENKDFVALHQSTLRKVDIIETLSRKAYTRTLKTKTSWWAYHGGSALSFVRWVSANPAVAFWVGVAGLILTVGGYLVGES